MNSPDVEAVYPLSPMQQGILFHSIYGGDPKMYFQQARYLIQGDLDISAFKEAWQSILHRHAILRTTFLWEGTDHPVQVVFKQVSLPWKEHDWQGLGDDEKRVRLEQLIDEDRRRGFDLAQAPLMRICVVRIENAVHEVIWSFHHLLIDGWSLSLIVQEMLEAYAALCQGGTPDVRQSRPYSDYIDWLQRQDLESAESYWRKALKGFIALPQFHADVQHSPKIDDDRYGQLEWRVPAETISGLKKIARENHLTLNTVVQAAWALVLGRYGGCRDVIFGAVVSGRPGDLEDVEEIVGLFINTLPVRVRIDPKAQLLPWMQQLQLQQIEARQYDYCPLAEIQSWSDVPRGSPLFESIIAFENFPVGEGSEPSSILNIQSRPLWGTMSYPIGLSIDPGEELLIGAGHDRRVVNDDACRRMMVHLQAILAAMVATPEARLGELSLVSAEEKRQLHDINETWTSFSRDKTVHELVEEMALNQPLAVAVVCGTSVCYSDLNRTANQLARYLQSRGAGPEQMVGVCLERSVDLIVALLAILKSGAAYLPLAPEYPEERLRYMTTHSGVRLVVSNHKQSGSLQECEAEIIVLEEIRAQIEAESYEDLPMAQWPAGLAYVTYTSGSTGKPKGIEVTHANIVRLVRENWYARLHGEVILGFAPVSFDASTFEIWGALCNGGSIALVPEERPSLESLGRFIRETRVTTMFLTTALFNALVDAELQELQGVRQLLTGGEVMSARHMRAAAQALQKCQLANIYGPTEGTTFSTWYEIGAVIDEFVPIGKPIANARVYVLDADLGAVPVGITGELFIAGEGVARGYRGDPGQTAEKFLPDLCPKETGERMYRTGDLVRWREDGNLEFVGRKDSQVKVRGFRVEPGEIESMLGKHAGVKEAVVVVKQEAGMEKRLAAYVVGQGQERVTGEELRKYLRERLPEYMVPGVIERVEEMPLNANGKVNRQELAKMEIRVEGGEGYEEPQGEVERELARIWAEVLRVKRVGAQQSFFELGGDSILAIQISARAKQAGMQVKPRQIFEQRTLRGVAQSIGQEKQAMAEQQAVVGEAPLTPIQHWFFDQQFNDSHYSNMPMLMGANCPLKAELLRQAVGALMKQHDALRFRYQKNGNGWRQFCEKPEEQVPFEVVDLREVEGEEKRVNRLEEHATRLQGSLDLESGPLVRVALYEMAGSQRVLMVVHHLAVDMVSWRMLLEDLWKAYEQLERGEEVKLGEKTTSYKEWAEKLEELGNREELEREVEYWEKERPGDGGIDRGSGIEVEMENENNQDSVEAVEMELTEEETEKLLREVARQYRVSASEVMMASLGRVLRRWSGKRQVVVDVEGHGREESEVEGVNLTRTVGWFTAIYPVVLGAKKGMEEAEGAEEEPGIEELRRVKEKLRRVPRGGIGYGLLKYINRKPEIRERMRKLAPAQVSFNYLGQLDTPVSESSIFGATSGAIGPTSSPSSKRSYLIDVTGSVLDGKLRLQIGYSRNLHQRATIEQLASSYLDELRSIIFECDPAKKRSYTQSDFPLASLTEPTLKKLMRDYVDVEDVYPLSPTQQEMLFHSLALKESELGFVQLSLTLTAELDPMIFKRAWEKVVDRHEILRSAIAWDDEIKPLQIVHSRVGLPWLQLDWSNCSEAVFAGQFEDYLAQDRRQGFEFSKAPLMHLALIQRSDGRFSFVWSFHHLLLDGWSLPVVFQELWMLYTGLLRGEEPAFGPKPSFRDYIAWLKRQNLAEAESFWRNVLRGFKSPVTLVAGHEPVASPAALSASDEEGVLSPALSRDLEAMARENELTLNTLFEAAWALLLSRYSGQRDVVFGVTVSGRPADLPGIENMVGLFINTLPLRVQVEPASKVVPWLKQVQARLMDLCRYEHTPRAVVHNCSELPVGLPLFESTMVFENYPFDKQEAQQSTDVLEWRNDFSFGTRASTPLTLIVLPGQQIGLRIAYDGRRFGPAMIRRMLHHLDSLLTEITLRRQGTVADLAMVTQKEARQIVCKETGTPLELAHEMIARHAKAHPEKIAVRGDSVVTYGFLEQQSNLLAGRLAAQIKGETAVAVVIERSADLIIAILGVLKAGGTCQVVDAAMSDREVLDALASTMPAIIVAHENTRQRVAGYKASVIYVGSSAAPNGSAPPTFLRAKMESPALVLVRPDGRLIPVSHGALAGALQTLCQPQILNTSSTFIAAHGGSGGIAVLDLIAPLAAGACLVISHTSENDSSNLIAEFAQASRPVIRLTFVAWERLLAIPEVAWHQLICLCSGELQSEIAERLSILGASVWRLYEVDEAGIIAAAEEIAASHSSAIIRNSAQGRRLLVLDADLQPAAIGVAGDLCIAGDAVSVGYLNDMELTAQSFVPDPLTTEAGSRVFITGDRARWRDDHAIELLGKNGSMVQVMGRSIDISRIERELISHPEIVEATVALCEETAGQTRAVAYFVPRSNSTISIQGIRAYLRERLPEFMLPSDYVPMTGLPRTPQGAIAAESLPTAGSTHSFSRILLVGDIASHDILEFQLARVWEEVFDIRPISPNDNFFELGGDSLTALSLASRIREKLSFDLPLAALFEGATIRDMAAMLRQQNGDKAWSSLVPIQPHGTRPPFFCVHAAGGNVLGFVDLLHHLDQQYPFYGLQSIGLDGVQEPYSRVEDMAEHYLRDIRTVQPHGPYYLGGLSFGGVVAFEMARQLRQQGENVALLALIDTWAPLFEGKLLFRQILPPDDFTLLTHYIKGVRHFYEEYPEEKRKLQGLTFSQQIDRVVEQMNDAELFGTVSREHARRVLQIHLHSARAMRDFEPRIYDGKITVFRATDVGPEAHFVITHPALGSPQVMAGWQQVSTEPIEVIDVPGDHITMIVEPQVHVLAERLNECLAKLQYASGVKQ